MSVRVEFFYDLSSPWTRLAFHNFREGIAGRDVAVSWRPFLVGGVFNAVNQSVYESRAIRTIRSPASALRGSRNGRGWRGCG
jgi:2-hydroxychromene-2-carboxylate isomerase